MTILRDRGIGKTIEFYNEKDKKEGRQAGDIIVVRTPAGLTSKKYKSPSIRKELKARLVRSNWLKFDIADQLEAAVEEIKPKMEKSIEVYYISSFHNNPNKNTVALQRRIIEEFEKFRTRGLISYLEVSKIENNRLNIKVSIPRIMDNYDNEFELYNTAASIENSEKVIIHLDIYVDKNRA